MKKLLFIILFQVAASAVTGEGIRQLQLNEAQLIDSGPNNYGLYDPDLLSQNNWNTVTVNGAEVTIWSPECQATTSQGLSEKDKNSLNSARAKVESVAKGSIHGGSNQHIGVFKFSSDGQLSSLRNINSGGPTSSFSINGAQYISNGRNSFSISKPDLPNNLARIFHDDKLTTFVYSNGTVQMQPTTCLAPSDQQLVEQLKVELQKSRREMQETHDRQMQNMNRKMEQMNQNMRQNMENMQRDMSRSMQNMNRNMESMNRNMNFGNFWS